MFQRATMPPGFYRVLWLSSIGYPPAIRATVRLTAKAPEEADLHLAWGNMKSRAIHELRVEPSLAPKEAPRHNAVASSRQPSASCAAPGAPAINALAHYLTRPFQRLVPLVFALSVLTALAVGWSNKDEGHLTPETGIGYWLGIAGATMMLLLLLYPLRKRVRILRHLGRVPAWFRLHMLLGVLGPTLILFHSNFKLGSLNSNVALAAMLIVVASGIVGRYLYAKVHNGLYGRKSDVGEIIGDAQVLKDALGDDLAGAETILNALHEFESRVLAPRRSVLSSLGSFLSSGFKARGVRRAISSQAEDIISAQARHYGWSRRERRRRLNLVRNEIALYFAAVAKAARFAVYERLLALWHVMHLPLFLLLVITAILHVVAVHHY